MTVTAGTVSTNIVYDGLLLIPVVSLIKYNFVNMYNFYPRSTKAFTRTCSEMPVHSRIELEFGNVGF